MQVQKRFLLMAVLLCASSPAVAQVKIEEELVRDLQTEDRVRVLIVTRPDIGVGDASLTSMTGIMDTLGQSSNASPIGQLPIATADISSDQLEYLQENPNVVLVVRDVPVPPTLFESGPQVGAPTVHRLGFKGTGTAVAILDTGVQADHPALAGSIVAQACFSTGESPDGDVESLCPGGFEVSLVANAAGGCPAEIKGCEHGTHVAGIVAGHQMSVRNIQFDGISPDAKIIAIQVFTKFNDSRICNDRSPCILSYTSDQLRALEWVYKQRDRFPLGAVNMSLGGGYFDAYCDKQSPLTEIIERLRSKGIATVISAGNNGFFDGLAQPACISAAISVAGLNKRNELDVTYTNVSELIDIAAPGTEITSSVMGGRYGALSGTSMAAPHVAAALALLRQRFPKDTVRQLEEKLRRPAQMAEDPRSETELPILQMSNILDASSVGETTAVPTGGSGVPTADPEHVGGSFIVQSKANEVELQRSLSESCPEAECSVEQIGEDAFKVDVGKAGSSVPIPAMRLEEVFKSIDGGAKIYDNRLSNTLKF